MNQLIEQFGMRLKLAREQAGKTMGEVCDHLNLSYSSMDNYERGHSYPKVETLLKFTALYKTTPDFLFLGVTHTKQPDTEIDVQLQEDLRIAQENGSLLESLVREKSQEVSFLKDKITSLQDRIRDKDQAISALDRVVQTLDKVGV